jgi:hypothetical protein
MFKAKLPNKPIPLKALFHPTSPYDISERQRTISERSEPLSERSEPPNDFQQALSPPPPSPAADRALLAGQ